MAKRCDNLINGVDNSVTKTKIREIINTGLTQKKLCRVFLRYDTNYRYYFPLICNDKLFLGAEEDDFILDGYCIRRFKDVTKVQIKNDMCNKILKLEGITDNLTAPDVDITSWEAVFKSLQKQNNNVIVEKESLDEESEFIIGRIEKVYKKFACVRHFDADGIWQDESYKMLFTEITSVTFASRYVNVFSKYLSAIPDNFGK